MLLLLMVPARGHDLWLLPPTVLKKDEKATVTAISGSEFPIGDHTPDPAKFAKRRVIQPDGSETAADASGTKDNGGLLSFTPTKPGLYIVAVETTPKLTQLEAAAFNEYLVSDGLFQIFRLRAKAKELDKDAIERYSKSPKVLFRVGDGKDGDPSKPIGLPLEIVPLADPLSRKVGDTLKVRVLFQAKPLANANLGWSHPGDGDTPVGTVRTDARGEALIPIAKGGLMTIRLTHMTRPKAKDYEWESFWTSLTFRLPD